MKKFLAFLFSAVLGIACAVGAAGCGKDSGKIKVFAPDGAPALSLYALSGEEYADFTVSVVNASTITNYVTGRSPKADFAILPVNSAVKELGDGKFYRMLGTVTHGNLFILKKATGELIETSDDLSKLVGKTVGVINLANVPGLTFKTILTENGIEFKELKDGAAPVDDMVNLISVDAENVLPSNTTCDYFVAPEPAVSTKVKATEGKLSVAGSLQTLYGGENGYPQAVAVAKVSVISKNKAIIDKFLTALEEASGLLLSESVTAEEVVATVSGWLVGDLKPTFTSANLSKAVIENCGISFVPSQSCKEEVSAYMQKVNALSDNAFGTPADKFFELIDG